MSTSISEFKYAKAEAAKTNLMSNYEAVFVFVHKYSISFKSSYGR